ncbi:MAG: CinA family protein, partial [Candidatus Omnitrophica bacterium]|nr:CinA family protein [Candidatus Omnitrophota bacterium]
FLAENVRKITQADFGIGLTGIAGPTGGTKRKPVGTVFIAIDTPNKKICKKFYIKGDRLKVRERAALKVLELLNSLIKV